MKLVAFRPGELKALKLIGKTLIATYLVGVWIAPSVICRCLPAYLKRKAHAFFDGYTTAMSPGTSKSASVAYFFPAGSLSLETAVSVSGCRFAMRKVLRKLRDPTHDQLMMKRVRLRFRMFSVMLRDFRSYQF